eukprot:12897799-Prorocentrum_lima.AAC.1
MKVAAWKRRVCNGCPISEVALLLYDALKGDAAKEVEFVDLDRVGTDGGIDYIVNMMSSLCAQRRANSRC